MERIRIFSEIRGIPGLKLHMPRTIKSMLTPAWEAWYRLLMLPVRWGWLILAKISAGLPILACSACRSILAAMICAC